MGGCVERGVQATVPALQRVTGVVVVQRADVRVCVLPTIVGDHRTRAVDVMSEVVQAVQESRRDVRLDGLQAEALVHRHPRDDARMTAITRHRLLPFGREPALSLGRVLVKARHLLPHQEAESVRPVEPARVFDLLVLASAVETK